MYIYNLCQFEPFIMDIYLIHEKEFSQEEFKTMCEEMEIKYRHSHIAVISKHLEDKYGFKKASDCTIGYYEYNPIN